MYILNQSRIIRQTIKQKMRFPTMRKMSSGILFLVAQVYAANSYALTFDWETATDDGATVSQTVDGVTATVSTSSSDAFLVDGGGIGGSTGNVITSEAINITSMTVTFNGPVDLDAIFVYKTSAFSGDWIFTPTGGGNTAGNQVIGNPGTTVNLNWVDVTGFTITNPTNGTDAFALDDITFTVSPAITSATYDADTGMLVVTGTNFEANAGALDVDVSLLTFTGEGGSSYTITDNVDVEIDNATQFTVTLNGVDLTAVTSLLNKSGTSSTDATIYNLAVADDFITAVTAGDSSDVTNNGITVSLSDPVEKKSGGGFTSPLTLMMLLSLIGLRQKKLAVA